MTTMQLNDLLADEVQHTTWAEPAGRSMVQEAEPSSRAEVRWGEVESILHRWRANPGSLAEEGVEPPAERLLQLLLGCAARWSKQGVPPPDATVPSGKGGVGFEWHFGDQLVDLEFRADGVGELRVFDGRRFHSLRRLTLP